MRKIKYNHSCTFTQSSLYNHNKIFNVFIIPFFNTAFKMFERNLWKIVVYPQKVDSYLIITNSHTPYFAIILLYFFGGAFTQMKSNRQLLRVLTPENPLLK